MSRRPARLPHATLLVMMAVACRGEPARDSAQLVVEFREEVPAGALEVTPRALGDSATLRQGRLLHLKVAPGRGRITLRAPGACPLSVDTLTLESGKTLRLQAKPWIDLGPPRPELGLAKRIRIEDEPGCSEAREGSVSWRHLEGEPPRDLRVSRRGFLLEGTTRDFEELFPEKPGAGVIPVSPATQGRMLFEASWRKGELEQRATVQLSALARSRGLPNVPTDATVLLAGSDWRLERSPDGAQAELVSGAGFSLLRPRTSGRWVLQNAHGDELSMFSAAYQDVPLDCARAGCHAAHDPKRLGGMSDVLSRGLSGALGADYRAACALGCHAVGEPGLADGGFHHVAELIGFEVDDAGAHAELPPALQRLANVGCLGCHGPGAIPEPSARWKILRVDVCAYCHDAPPRYGHVAAWRTSAMSQAGRNPQQREQASCAGCHTTWGFLQEQGDESSSRRPPEGEALGISCVACHAVHQDEPRPGLLRRVVLPEVARHLGDDATSRVCLSCHAPRGAGDGRASFPEASAAALWLGRGGFSEAGAPLEGSAVHATSPEGCLSCHTGGESRLERGGSHSFAADPKVCGNCHEQEPNPGEHQARARRLLEALVTRFHQPWSQSLRTALGTDAKAPSHPLHSHPGVLDVTTRAGRAAYNVLLVLEDPAAGVHNAAYATLLLDHAERMLDTD